MNDPMHLIYGALNIYMDMGEAKVQWKKSYNKIGSSAVQ